MKRWLVVVLAVALALPAVADELLPWTEDEVRAVARHGPWPPPPPRDASNRVSGNAAAARLGEVLFNDPRLSADGRTSCASCHVSGRDWADGRARGLGRTELDRRTPSLWNVGHGHWFGWDGAADSLWAQSIRPILDPREMASDAGRVATLLRDDRDLGCGYERAFGVAPGEDDEALLVDAGKAMAAFQATLVSPRTPFDGFRDALVAGDKASAARYPIHAQRGFKVFDGAGCANCHFGPRFTNGEFGDIGVPFFTRPGEVDAGRLDGLGKLAGSVFNLLGRYNDDPTGQAGLRTRHVQRLHSNFGEFRVPSLRQPGAGPYMHNGQMATLEEVVRHYSEVSPDRLHSDAVPLVRPLGLTPRQADDLVAFLRTLSVEVPPRPAPGPLCP